MKIHNDFGLLHVSNYGAGSFVSFSLDDSGEIMEQVYAENFGKGSGVKPDRQMESHPHGAWTYGPFVYVADLGSDKIWHYIVSSTLYLLLFLSSSLDPIYYLLKRCISTAAKKICRVLIYVEKNCNHFCIDIGP